MTTGKLYSVRVLRGLATEHETARLYDWQARDLLLEHGFSEEQAIVMVAAASESGAEQADMGDRTLLVLASSY